MNVSKGAIKVLTIGHYPLFHRLGSEQASPEFRTETTMEPPLHGSMEPGNECTRLPAAEVTWSTWARISTQGY